jgi:hypothetical protein
MPQEIGRQQEQQHHHRHAPDAKPPAEAAVAAQGVPFVSHRR